MLKNIEDSKSMMEELNDICEILMEKSALSGVRDQVNDLQEKYNSLLLEMQGNFLLTKILLTALNKSTNT